MAGPQKKVSFLLTGSFDELTTEEMRAPVVSQAGTPSLTDQRNTRLSLVPGTCIRAPAVRAQGVQLRGGVPLPGATTIPAYGIVGNERKRNYALFTTPDAGNRMVAEDGFETRGTGQVTDREGELRQSVYVPFSMPRTAQLPDAFNYEASRSTDPWLHAGISAAYNEVTGELWHAWVRKPSSPTPPEPPQIEVCAYDREGTLICRPTVVFSPTSPVLLQEVVGLTAHGANGIRLWYLLDQSGIDGPGAFRIAMRTVTITSGNVGAIGPLVVVGEATTSYFGVTSGGPGFAYVVAAATDGTPRVYKVNVLTGAETHVAFGSMAGFSNAQCAVNRVVTAGGNELIAATCASSDNDQWACSVVDQNLALQLNDQRALSTSPTFTVGVVACGILLSPALGVRRAIFALSRDGSTTFPPTWSPGDVLTQYAQTAGAIAYDLDAPATPAVGVGPIYHSRLLNRGAQWQLSESEAYPVLYANRGGLDPSGVGYLIGAVDDERVIASPVARFGCVRGGVAPCEYNPVFHAAAESVAWMDGMMVVPYRKDDIGSSGRVAFVSTVPEQPSVAHDRDGVSIMSAALVTQWDGAEVEVYGGPLYAPEMVVYPTATATPLLPMGAYGFTCIYEWLDNAGLLHRSMPCPTQSVQFSGTDGLNILITTPTVMQVGLAAERVRISVYMTDTNGTAYMLVTQHDAPVRSAGFYGIANVHIPDLANPIIYSRGLQNEELVPQPPPPLRDLTIIGSRAWGIDAEYPSRIVYSKLRVAGVGFEFFVAGEVIVPANAGDALAIRELRGTLVIFAERGIYQVADGGPNNMGQGGSYGPPYKLSDVGAVSRHGIIATPAGIVFVDVTEHFSTLSAALGGVTPLSGADASGAVTGSFLVSIGEEACFIVGNVLKVFNYALGRWSLWDLPVAPSLYAQSAITREDALLYAATNGQTYTVDGDSLSPTVAMRWRTDWILFGGDFQDYAVIYDVWFNAYRDSAHGIRIEVFTDYATTPTTSREWTDAELVPLLGPKNRYSVRVEPVRQDARAFQVVVTELAPGGTFEGCRPGSLTVVYSIDGLTYEEASIPGALK